MNKEELLELIYSQKKDFIYEHSQREFECLVTLVEDGTITEINIEDYGIELSPTEKEIDKKPIKELVVYYNGNKIRMNKGQGDCWSYKQKGFRKVKIKIYELEEC